MLARAGVPERIGYRGELRGALLTRAVRLVLGPGEHQVWKHLRLAAAAGAPLPAAPNVSWPISDEIRESARVRLKAAGWKGQPFAAAHVASFAHAAKRWELARFAAVFDGLAARRGLPVVLLGSSAEKARQCPGLRSRDEDSRLRRLRRDIAARSARHSRGGAALPRQ